jgi:hypothetical protein
MLKRPLLRPPFRQLEDLFHTGIAGDLSDSELLDRFLRCRDSVGEAAFTALVERHGPMVFQVCRQALNDHHSAQKFRTTISNPDGRYKAGMFVRVVLETGASSDRIDERRGPREQPLDATENDRLSELERKVDRLLSEKEERSAHATILERLDALERKLDRLLDGRKDARP